VNAYHNRRFIATIAGRPSTGYAKISPKKLATAAQRNGDRYEAVNLQNSNTIEFRLFKGTLKGESVYKALEFCDAIIAYCGCATRTVKDSQSRVKFIEFVKENAKSYPHLHAFIEARWFGRESKETIKYGFRARSTNQEERASQYEETEE
jgi:hypothetical protein